MGKTRGTPRSVRRVTACGLPCWLQDTIERLFRHPIEPRGLVHETPPLRAPGRQRRETAPEIHQGFGRNGVMGHGSVSRGSLPQAFKPVGGRPGIACRVFRVPMAQIILNHPQIIAAIGQGVAAAMPQHMRMDVKPHAGALAGDCAPSS